MTAHAFRQPLPDRRWLSLWSLAGLLLMLAACYGVAALGSAVTLPAVGGWYAGLEKPPFTPPDAVFGPVWAVLYGLMALAAWRVWVLGRGTAAGATALAAFFLQLLLNLAWSFAFFGAESPGAGLGVIALLLLAVIAAVGACRRVDFWAPLILLPYLAWTAFAAALNAAIWWLNG